MRILKVDSVQMEYEGRKILRDVHLTCKQGEIVGLLGRNGCGKSSLLKVIFGLVKPAYRYVAIDGQVIGKGYHGNQIAYLPQHHYLPKGVNIHQLAKFTVDPKLWPSFEQLPIFEICRDKKANELSSGQLRHLETMIVVHSKADFILLDEPFTHISPLQADEFKEAMRNCVKTKGIIITDHRYYNILEVSDKIVLLDNGCTKHITDTAELVTYGYLSGINR